MRYIGTGKTIQAESLNPEIIIYQKINLKLYMYRLRAEKR